MIRTYLTDINSINSMRNNYLNTLCEFQEYYLEILVNESESYIIEISEETAGYVLITNDHILVEFHLKTAHIPYSNECFLHIVQSLDVEKVYCKSFDHLLLSCCMHYSLSYKTIGLLFRDCHQTAKSYNQAFDIRMATHADYDLLLQQEGELYEKPEELAQHINANCILLFEKDKQLKGCGYLIQVHKDWNYYDIGMWVNPDYRKQGIAGQIIAYLKEYCLTNNFKAICGCAIDNRASQKTLERNGFVSNHRLIEFDTDNTICSQRYNYKNKLHTSFFLKQ